jgi:hypothetical protein
MSTKLNPVNGTLWALGIFDPALALFAEIRQNIPDGDPANALDRAISIYLEAQADALLVDHGHTTEDINTLATRCDADEVITDIVRKITRLTEDEDGGLLLEICGFALCLGSLGQWRRTPWLRFRRIVEYSWNENFPTSAVLTEPAPAVKLSVFVDA